MDNWRSSVIFVVFLMNISCLNLLNIAFGTLDFVKSGRFFELRKFYLQLPISNTHSYTRIRAIVPCKVI